MSIRMRVLRGITFNVPAAVYAYGTPREANPK